MLVQYLPQLAPHRIVLASASPRRQELLTLLGFKCEVVPSTFAEDLPHGDHSPASYVRETARHKTLEVAQRIVDEGGKQPALIIGADTVVYPVCYLAIEECILCIWRCDSYWQELDAARVTDAGCGDRWRHPGEAG